MPRRKNNLELYEKRFGVVAIEMGYIHPEDLVMALKIQILEALSGTEHRRIGSILLDEKRMTAAQLKDVLDILFNRRNNFNARPAQVIDIVAAKDTAK